MAAALRSVKRLQQVLLLPRICVTCVRAESGGKSSSHTGTSKTLVSFPVKGSYYQQQATGENRNESLKPVKAPLLETGGSGGQSDRETQLGQEVSHSGAQSVDGTSHKEDDSSSSSSSDSESEEEDNRPKKVESGGGHKKLPPAAQKSSSMPGETRLGKKSLVAQEQKDRTDLRGENSEHMQDCAPVVTTEDQNLHAAPLSTKWTAPGADRMIIPDRSAVTEGASSTTSVKFKKTKTLSRSEELRTKEVEMFSGTTQILTSTRTSEELPAGGAETLASESMESHIISTTRTSEELPAGGAETLAPESMESHIISTTRTSEELPAGGAETLASESMESHIISTTRTSEELPVGGAETLVSESMESHIISTTRTSEELPVGGAETLVSESMESHIISTTRTSEELPAGGAETLAPESMESHIISTTRTSEELPAGGAETLASESMESHIISTTRTSEELPVGGAETLVSESMESHIISTTRTSEELPAVDEASELHGSHSSSEPRVAPQELFDNTKYQNLQHFTYTPFTFVDMDVEMAKYRLPQPSSGRPSPRH